MTEHPQISIVVAVYNAEAFLPDCIEAVLSQTYGNFDLLLVDDGSIDNTAIICDDYAAKDARIRVFHERHAGVAHARQIGIENALGKYTIHIDADDKIVSSLLEDMYFAAEESNADLLICDYHEIKKEGTVYHVQQPTALNHHAVANDIIEGKLYGALWNKLIRTSCFKDNRIGFHQDLSMREDMFFVLDVLPYISQVAYLPKTLYFYDKTNNNQSLTNTYLVENRHYYEQEVKWCGTVLNHELITPANKSRTIRLLLNYAYITLQGNIIDEKDWYLMFQPFKSVFQRQKQSHKKWLVLLALTGHYSLASKIRGCFSKLGHIV